MALTLPELSDKLLLEKCREGNTKAFDVLFDRYSAKLYHYALKYIKDEAVAEESMMDLMLWVWEKRHQLDPDIQFAPYIFRAMKNAIIKVLTRKPFVTYSFDDLSPDLSTSMAYNADHRIQVNELSGIYLEKLDELSRQRKIVFKMSREDNLSHAEIAKEMNLSLSTVKNHIKASLSHFRHHLKDYVDITTVILLCFFPR
ncbi:RNA polymerase sigma-70 factor [Chitinophaga niabensis]|uniref:RNA polymerase sigma-70 factor n=1 Tax=Chitinophaga niabensis TaxID=536979 RepID=UPI0031BB4023